MLDSPAARRRACEALRVDRGAFDGLLASRTGPELDPVHLVRRYSDPGDQEVAGLIAALFAYGRVEMVCRNAEWILDRLGPSPRQSLLDGLPQGRAWGLGFRYRFNTRSDLVALLRGAASLLREYGSLGQALAHHRSHQGDPESALQAWTLDLRLRGAPHGRLSPGLKHLLPDPALGGACKRWRLYLRWMIRPADEIDLGTWRGLLDPSELVVPLDAHWIRMGPRLGLTGRRAPGGAMAREITAGLRRLSPEDPLRYDYPVCHLGIRGGCPIRLTAAHCAACPLLPACPTGRTKGGAAPR